MPDSMTDLTPPIESPVVPQQMPPRRSSPWPWVVLAIVLTPLLIFIIFVVLTLGGIAATWHTVQNLAAGRMVIKPEPAAVVTQVRDLGRLETVSYTVEKVIEGGQTHGSPILDLFVGDRLLFIAHGDVVAGVDLTRLSDRDVTVSPDGRSVTIRLPAAQVLSSRLDNEQSRVYDRQTGLLTGGDPGLETKVRQEAEQEIVAAACQDGILDQADRSAQAQVRTLLELAHFNQVQFLQPGGGNPTGCEINPG